MRCKPEVIDTRIYFNHFKFNTLRDDQYWRYALIILTHEPCQIRYSEPIRRNNKRL
ncbi:hypothetical protein PanABDRAFT_2377 [Pantoea sp. aB]|nr:hypothetical protein PanABDRAFT_2377 [Pantoea sp. aB]SJZ35256.1 hypothetical protein SAMN03097723_0702 [Pantoea eucalypti]